ncbi:MAG: hypothetical protein JNL26_12780 [Gemmatimonadetes bacterium]|nr:hypothetical protein [Gemmatimonadota bacterium]
MTSVTAAMAVPLKAASDRLASARRRLLTVSGVASIAVGIWLALSLARDAGWGRAVAP